jgi:hypothetical protein
MTQWHEELESSRKVTVRTVINFKKILILTFFMFVLELLHNASANIQRWCSRAVVARRKWDSVVFSSSSDVTSQPDKPVTLTSTQLVPWPTAARI